jgi:hypothetical protein
MSDGSTKTMTANIDFKIKIYPCKVQSYELVSAPIGTVTYILGNERLSFGTYSFA